MQISFSSTFKKAIKRLHKNQKKELDDAVIEIIKNPSIGELKKGDLRCVLVHKFKMNKQLTLLAYIQINDAELFLIAFGSHENFYRDIKNIR
jgi:mRNA-degrading endonuclease RelE of RelBE toxin-antitoxin system